MVFLLDEIDVLAVSHPRLRGGRSIGSGVRPMSVELVGGSRDATLPMNCGETAISAGSGTPQARRHISLAALSKAMSGISHRACPVGHIADPETNIMHAIMTMQARKNLMWAGLMKVRNVFMQPEHWHCVLESKSRS